MVWNDFFNNKVSKKYRLFSFSKDFWEIANECSLNNSKNWIFNFEIY